MEFNNIRHILSCVRRAVEKYEMIEEGDRIAVGLSGGKDSTALFCALKNLQLFYPKHFELVGITVSMGFEGMDYTPLSEMCKSCGCEFKLVETELKRVIFDERRAQKLFKLVSIESVMPSNHLILCHPFC